MSIEGLNEDRDFFPIKIYQFFFVLPIEIYKISCYSIGAFNWKATYSIYHFFPCR